MAGLVHQHPDLALFGTDDHRLAAHATDHVKWVHRAAPKRQFECVFLDAALQGLLQLVGDFEESVGRAQAADTLVRASVIVIFDPKISSLHRLLEAVELGPLEELAQDRFPETLDLSQGHGMVGTRTDMLDTVLFHLPLEARLAPPVGVLAAVVGEHLPGHTVFGNTPAIGLQHMGGRLAAVQSQGGDVAAVIVHEADQVGVASGQPEGHDVALPQLVGTGALEKPGLGRILYRFALGLADQSIVGQRSMDS